MSRHPLTSTPPSGGVLRCAVCGSVALWLWLLAFGSLSESSRRASRAPEPGVAEEQPMSERSEFGLRAASGEERRAPMRLHRIGSRPAKGPFGSFWVHPKGTRTRSGRKPCTWLRFSALAFDFDAPPDEVLARRRSSTGLPRCRAAYFCLGKSKQNRLRRTRSAAIQPRRSPALLGRRGTQPKLAALRHGLLFDPAALRCSARFTARLKSKAKAKLEQTLKQKQRRKRMPSFSLRACPRRHTEQMPRARHRLQKRPTASAVETPGTRHHPLG